MIAALVLAFHTAAAAPARPRLVPSGRPAAPAPVRVPTPEPTPAGTVAPRLEPASPVTTDAREERADVVRLVATSAGEVRFQVRAPEPAIDTVAAPQGGASLQLALGGFSTEARAGEPVLPVRVVRVAVPTTGPVEVSASGSQQETRDDVVLGAPPVIHRAAEAVAAVSPLRVQPGALRAARAELRGITWLRNQRVAEIAVFPADYDRATHRLTLWRQVDVAVSVHPAPVAGPPAEPADPFEPVYRAALVNYQQGAGWRRPAPLAAQLDTTGAFAGRAWVRLAIPTTGFYKVTFAQLRQLGAFQLPAGPNTTVRKTDLRLVTWSTAIDPRAVGSPLMPEKTYCDSCGYRQVSIGVVASDPTYFNHDADYLYFYALGPNGWATEYDPGASDSLHDDHPFEAHDFYYLTVDSTDAFGPPARIATQAASAPGAGTPVTEFDERLHYEQDNEYFPDPTPLEAGSDPGLRWEKWYWRGLTANVGGEFAYAMPTPGIDVTQPARLRAVIWGLNWPVIPLGYIPTLPTHYTDVSIDNVLQFPRRSSDGAYGQMFDSTFAPRSAMVFRVHLPTVTDPGNPARLDRQGVAYIEMFYRRQLTPVSGTLYFRGAGAGAHDYRLAPFARPDSLPYAQVFDVTWPNAPVQITGLTLNAADSSLSFGLTEGGVRSYRLISDFLPVPQTGISEVAAGTNLRASTEAADYLVIYYDGFKAAADSLAAWRSEHLPGSAHGHHAEAIPVSALYDQFAGGHQDPAAIRSLMRNVFYNWNGGQLRTAWITLLGDASFDHKNVFGNAQPGQPGCLLPTYENGYDGDFQVRRQYTTDDWMFDAVRTGGEVVGLPDFYVGRLPVNDPATALDVVRNKVLEAERANALGVWRNRVVLVADDNIHGNVDEGFYHLLQTASLDKLHVPYHIDRAYVYLHTYRTEPGPSKPEARQAIRDYLNDGCLIINYVGHGSPYQLADERVLLDSDVGTLSNAPRFGLFLSASCDVGKFIDPTVQSLGELLITKTHGGCLAVISSTELAFSNQNAQLNADIYDALFRPGRGELHDPAYESLRPDTTGEIAPALLIGKVQSPSTNSSKYELLGDAASHLPLPQRWIEVTITDTTGTPVTTLPHGALLAFHGRVLDRIGGALVPMDGAADVLIEDSRPNPQAPGSFFTYPYKAGPMYHGIATVRGGSFDGRFVVPLEARQGPDARARAYAQGRAAGDLIDRDGVGSDSAGVAAGAPLPGDTRGPQITLAFAGGSTSVKPDAVLRVDLFDPSGILTTGHALQNGIVATLDDNSTNRTDITASFRYAADSYQQGTAQYPLPHLSLGHHSITVTAADNLASGLSSAAHRSTARIEFEVVDNPPLRIARTYLFPSPARSGGAGSGGQFVVDVAADSVNVLLRIYTPTGRLVRTLQQFGGQAWRGQVQLPWDGLDDEGDPLANGVYFYRVHLNPRDTDGSSSPRQKAEADGRFVIVNR